MPRAFVRQGLPVAPVERALVDAQRLLEHTDRELKAMTLAVLQNRLSTADRVSAELELAQRTGTGGIIDGVIAFRAGAWSAPEALLAGGVRDRVDLPVMIGNPKLKAGNRVVGTPDGFFPDAGVAVQVHSKRYHRGLDAQGVDKWEVTLDKDMEFQKYDVTLVPVAASKLINDLDGFVAGLAPGRPSPHGLEL